MSESVPHSSSDHAESPVTTAGQLLRQAREASGLHIVALAAALKVPVRKLEALEMNRWDELTDATFARALASSVARHLKIDPTPVLMGLPSVRPVSLSSPVGLGHVGEVAASGPTGNWTPAISLARHSWVISLLLLGAAVLFFWPQLQTGLGLVATSVAVEPSAGDVSLAKGESVTAEPITPPAASETAKPVSAPSATPDTLPPATISPVLPSGSASVGISEPSGAAVAAVLAMSASHDTWVEVTDSAGRVLIQRVLKKGEDMSFADGAPYAVVVGNAAGANVLVRGQSLDLASLTKNNVARFAVK